MKLLKTISNLFKRRRSSFFYSKRYYCNTILKRYENVNSYLDIILPHNHVEVLYTDQKIQFSNSEKFENDEFKYFVQKYGSPHISKSNKFSFGKIKIMVYQINIDESKVILELHFFNETLFMYSYNFPGVISESKSDKLLKIFWTKYRLDFDQLSKNKSFIVKNSSSALISVTQGATLKAEYFPNTRLKLFSLMQKQSAFEEKKLTLEKKALNKELFRRL